MQKLLLLYRGSNPFMAALGDELSSRGVEVEQKAAPMDYFQRSEEEQQKILSQLAAGYRGIVCCDRTLESGLTDVLEQKPLSVYDVLLKIPVDFGDILGEIDRASKIPVVLQSHLYDHSSGLKKGSLPSISYDESWNAKCTFRGRTLTLIGEGQIRIKHREHRGNLIETLQAMGLKPEEVVILADHHIYEMDPEEVRKTGFDQVLVALVCPCCIGLRETYTNSVRKQGFKLFNLQLANYVSLVADEIRRLMDSKIS